MVLRISETSDNFLQNFVNQVEIFTFYVLKNLQRCFPPYAGIHQVFSNVRKETPSVKDNVGYTLRNTSSSISVITKSCP
jgi:hypothetical protein